MAKSNTKINYDEEDDILFISKERKVKASIDVGEFIVDIDHTGHVTGLEIINATKNLALSEIQLQAVDKGTLSVTYKPNYVYITLVLQMKGKEKDVTIPLAIDLGHQRVLTEKTSLTI